MSNIKLQVSFFSKKIGALFSDFFVESFLFVPVKAFLYVYGEAFEECFSFIT